MSPDDADGALGARTVKQEIQVVDTDSIIMLDAFPVEQQDLILSRLSKRKCSRWVVVSRRERTKGKVGRLLASVGMETESIVQGQQGTQLQDGGKTAWTTGNTRVGKFESPYAVWVGGKGEHIDPEKWEEAWNMEYQFSPPIQALTTRGQAYW